MKEVSYFTENFNKNVSQIKDCVVTLLHTNFNKFQKQHCELTRTKCVQLNVYAYNYRVILMQMCHFF